MECASTAHALSHFRAHPTKGTTFEEGSLNSNRVTHSVDYLPNPNEKRNIALDRDAGEKEVVLVPDATKPLVALAFKLEESRFGQLTYMRVRLVEGGLSK